MTIAHTPGYSSYSETGAVANPLEELHNIEKVEKALHTLCTMGLHNTEQGFMDELVAGKAK